MRRFTRLASLVIASLCPLGCSDNPITVVQLGYDLVSTGARDMSVSPAPPDLAISLADDLSMPEPEDLSESLPDGRLPFDLTGQVLNGCNGLFRCVQMCRGANQCEQMCAAGATKMGKKLLVQLEACLQGPCPTARPGDGGVPDGGVPACAKPNSKECAMCRVAAVMGGPCAMPYQACLADLP